MHASDSRLPVLSLIHISSAFVLSGGCSVSHIPFSFASPAVIVCRMKGIMQEFMNVYIEYIDFLLAAFIAILPVNIF